jgi:glycosyltransferase involved in cell wall biosynthesis
MLGWEFPPFFSGGLGVATYGMVRALSPKVDIKLIIPNNSGNIALSNVNIVGLNATVAQELNLEALQFNYASLTSELHSIPLTLSPYHHVNEEILKNKLDELDTAIAITKQKKLETIHTIFGEKDVYGQDIVYKISLYAKLVGQLAEHEQFDVIHAHDWITFPAGIHVKQITKKPLILHVHSLETDRAGETVRNEIYQLEKEAMLIADRIVSVSQFTKDQIIKHYGINEAKICVVHNGIEPASKPRTMHHLRDKLVVFLGRITHQKGPEFLLETAEKVSRVYPRVKFVVAGIGDQFAHILETSAYKKMGSKFIFTGFLTKAKVDELLNMADVYFMPSVSEPFGITALEAAQHHIPTVLSRQSGAAEVINSSLKADFWDTNKYANYIYALLNYNALNHQLSENARNELDHLTWDHAAEKIWDVYQEFQK